MKSPSLILVSCLTLLASASSVTSTSRFSSSSSSTRRTTAPTTTTTRTTTTSATSSPTIFSIANFTASAFYHDSMRYQADVVYEPDPGFSARCLKNTDALTQCRNAAGLSPFDRTACDGPGGTNTDGRWYWRLKPAKAGFNFEIELDAGDISFIGRTLYACKFFPTSDVKCNDTARGQTGQPAAYLDAPRSFTVTAQTEASCSGDVAATMTATAT